MTTIKMKVLRAASGNHDARILSGEGVRTPDNSKADDRGQINWRGGEIIIVTAELAEKYQASGQAERIEEAVTEAATAAGAPELAVMPNPKKRRA